MSKFGFSPTFIRWIKACIKSPWIALLVNGRLTKFFQATKGIRKGCSLSPYPYLMVADSLSRKLQQQQDLGELKGLKSARGVRVVNHAHLDDDTILLGGASTIIAERFNSVLSTFLNATDGKLNVTKSKVYGWNCPLGIMARISRILGFEGITTWNSFNYLGIPIFKGEKKG